MSRSHPWIIDTSTRSTLYLIVGVTKKNQSTVFIAKLNVSLRSTVEKSWEFFITLPLQSDDGSDHLTIYDRISPTYLIRFKNSSTLPHQSDNSLNEKKKKNWTISYFYPQYIFYGTNGFWI